MPKMARKSISSGTATSRDALSFSLSLLFPSHPLEELTQGQCLLLKARAQLEVLLAPLPTLTRPPAHRTKGSCSKQTSREGLPTPALTIGESRQRGYHA